MKRALRWLVISIAIQLLLLIFLDSFYMNWRRGDIELFMLDETDMQPEEYSLKLPDGTIQTDISFDSRYIACLSGGKVSILEYTGKVLVTLGAEDKTIDSFTWLPDRNILLYAVESDDGTDIEIKTYEAPGGVLRSYPPITGLPRNSRVSEIQLSVLTRHVYVRVWTGQAADTIYRYNLLDELEEYLKLPDAKEFRILRLGQGIVYENTSENLTLKLDGVKEKTLIFDASLQLIGIDGKDNILAVKKPKEKGQAELGFIHLDDGSMEFRPIRKLNPDIPSESIFINQSGQIYIVEAENRFVNIGTGAVTSFDGELVKILNGRYAVLRDGMLWVKVTG